MAPGCTEQDYIELSKPVYGDSIENVELAYSSGNSVPARRLFFAGEHTTEQHPSTAHGAYLSGKDTASLLLKETFSKHDVTDEHVSISSYRLKFSKDPLRCQLCRINGNRKREGDLFAFRRGAHYAIAHFHCASFCPAVENNDSKDGWKNIVSEISRGRRIS